MIRQAKIQDLPSIMELFKVILTDMEHPLLEKYDWSVLKPVLVEVASQPDNRLGYPFYMVNEIDGEIAGYAGSYPSDLDENLDAVEEIMTRHHIEGFSDLFEDETFGIEWYLDCLVVSANFRGAGIGSKLLNGVYERANSEGYPAVGLNCDQDNVRARALYERQGFEKVAEIDLVGHMYDHMKKAV